MARNVTVMASNPCDIPIAVIKTRWPGDTRNKSILAAVLLLDMARELLEEYNL